MEVLLWSMTASTVSGPIRHFVWKPGDSGLCRTGDIRILRSALWQMKNGASGVRLVLVKRFPKGEQLDRVVAVCVAIVWQLEIWIGNVWGGPRALTVPLALLISACVAVRRRWPLAAGCAIVIGNGLHIFVASPGTSVANAVAWFCGLYAILRDRVQAVILAYESGLVSPGRTT
jgi:hypothetical protein